MNKVTVLQADLHRDFLEARRRDPVTRDVLHPGDKITLCAACLMPFLAKSWRAIGEIHCGQSASVGLEIFEASTPVHTQESDASSGINVDSKPAPPEVEQTERRLHLALIPIGLREVPVTLK